MKLHVTNGDVAYQYVQAKLFVEAGNVGVAEDCKNVLKHYWNNLNCGLVDVADIDYLYTKLCQVTRMITRAKGEA